MDQQEQGSTKDEGSTTRGKFSQRFTELEAKFREQFGELEQSLRKELREAIPPDVSERLQNSKREFLMAVRGLVDRELQRTADKKSTPADDDKQTP